MVDRGEIEIACRGQAFARGTTGSIFKIGSYCVKIAAQPGLNPKIWREFEILSKVDEHPGLIKPYYAGELDRRAYFVMDFFDGDTLREKPYRLSEAMDQLEDVLRHINSRSIQHNDLGPKKVLINDGGLVKLIDFGNARHRDRPDSTKRLILECH